MKQPNLQDVVCRGLKQRGPEDYRDAVVDLGGGVGLGDNLSQWTPFV
jgi:hypothetical protein